MAWCSRPEEIPSAKVLEVVEPPTGEDEWPPIKRSQCYNVSFSTAVIFPSEGEGASGSSSSSEGDGHGPRRQRRRRSQSPPPPADGSGEGRGARIPVHARLGPRATASGDDGGPSQAAEELIRPRTEEIYLGTPTLGHAPSIPRVCTTKAAGEQDEAAEDVTEAIASGPPLLAASGPVPLAHARDPSPPSFTAMEADVRAAEAAEPLTLAVSGPVPSMHEQGTSVPSIPREFATGGLAQVSAEVPPSIDGSSSSV